MAVKKRTTKAKVATKGVRTVTLYAVRSDAGGYSLFEKMPDQSEVFPLTVESLAEFKRLVAAEKNDTLIEVAGELATSLSLAEDDESSLLYDCQDGFRAVLGTPPDKALFALELEVSDTPFTGRSRSIWLTPSNDDYAMDGELVLHLKEPWGSEIDPFPRTVHSREEAEALLLKAVTVWNSDGMYSDVSARVADVLGVTVTAEQPTRVYIRKAK